jgi:hypothetical protein
VLLYLSERSERKTEPVMEVEWGSLNYRHTNGFTESLRIKVVRVREGNLNTDICSNMVKIIVRSRTSGVN